MPRLTKMAAPSAWPWRLHATYDETISRALDVFEKVDAETPFEGLHWFFDHAETISPRNIDRVARLGGGIAIQHRMAYQGEYFADRYGARAAEDTPPVARMIESGAKVSAGTDATRVASYNPWVCLSWLVTGRTLGGLALVPPHKRLSRERALRLWTEDVAWFSNEEGRKGRIAVGQLADLVVPDRDVLACPEADIAGTVSELTLLGGRVVWAGGGFATLNPPAPPVLPEWSPVRRYGGYAGWGARRHEGRFAARLAEACGCASACAVHGHAHAAALGSAAPVSDARAFWGALGCGCWAV